VFRDIAKCICLICLIVIFICQCVKQAWSLIGLTVLSNRNLKIAIDIHGLYSFFLGSIFDYFSVTVVLHVYDLISSLFFISEVKKFTENPLYRNCVKCILNINRIKRTTANCFQLYF
jgi:hypothetical protein